MPAASEGMTQECISDYLRKAAAAGVDTDTVLDVVRLWASHGTSAEEILAALDELERTVASPVLAIRRYTSAISDMLGGRPGVIQLDLPQQRPRETQARGRS